jgi:DNA topoisomerase IA
VKKMRPLLLILHEQLMPKRFRRTYQRPAKRAASGSLSGPKTKIAIIAKQSSSVIPEFRKEMQEELNRIEALERKVQQQLEEIQKQNISENIDKAEATKSSHFANW